MSEWTDTRSTLEHYGFVIDTDDYAGNFERPLVAFVTGVVGECGVGKKQAAQAREEFEQTPEGEALASWFDENVTQVPDHTGCHRPAAIFATPGWFNDGMGGHYPLSMLGSDVVREAHAKAHREYYEPHRQRAIKMRDAEIANGNSAARWEREIAGYDQSIKEAIKRGPGNHPCYKSVIVYLSEDPPTWVVDAMKARANVYCGKKGIAITGFRIAMIEKTERTQHV